MSSKNIINSNAIRNSENVTIWSHITSSLLQSWIIDKNPQRKLLIIDSRCTADYDTLHIKNAINIPYSKIIKRKLLNDKISIIELLMKNSTSTYLFDEVNIVVYDKHTEHSNQLVEATDTDNTPSDHAFSLILLAKLAQKFNSVSFLSGGFVDFKDTFTDLCYTSNPGRNSSNMPPGSSITPNSSTNSSVTNTPTTETINPTDKVDSEALVNQFKRKKHVLNHSISSYDTIEYFRQTSSLLKNNSNSTLDQVPLLNEDVSSGSASLMKSKCTPDGGGSPVIRDPTRILSHLYLGSQEDALSGATLKQLGITNVLNVSISCPRPEFIADANFLRISVNDGHAAKIRPFFDVAYRFIEKCRKANTKVIIHCLAGISRSPTLAIAYLMKHMNLRSDDAYKFVKDRRQTISPNFNFLGQLYEYDRQLSICQIAENTACADLNPTSHTSDNKTINSIPETDTIHNKTDPDIITQSSTKHTAILKLNNNNNNQLKSPCSNTSINNNSNYSDQILMETSPKQRRKQFIFPFSSSNINPSKKNDENMCITPPANLAKTPTLTQSPMIDNASFLLVQSPQAQTLPSPSQAFSKFNLNSPTVTAKSIVPHDQRHDQSLIINNHQSSSNYSLNNVSMSSSVCSESSNFSSQNNHQNSSGGGHGGKPHLPKSFSISFSANRGQSSGMLSLKKSKRPSELVIRRPTNLLMSLTSGSQQQQQPQNAPNNSLQLKQQPTRQPPTTDTESKKLGNALKRPSSILLDKSSSDKPRMTTTQDPNPTNTITNEDILTPDSSVPSITQQNGHQDNIDYPFLVNNNPQESTQSLIRNPNNHTNQRWNQLPNSDTNNTRTESSSSSTSSVSNSQISSSTCSCSPNSNSRSSSGLSMAPSSIVSLSSPTMTNSSNNNQHQLNPISLICTSCSSVNNSMASHHQNQGQQFQKKKIKLSPVQDRCVLNNFQMTQ